MRSRESRVWPCKFPALTAFVEFGFTSICDFDSLSPRFVEIAPGSTLATHLRHPLDRSFLALNGEPGLHPGSRKPLEAFFCGSWMFSVWTDKKTLLWKVLELYGVGEGMREPTGSGMGSEEP